MNENVETKLLRSMKQRGITIYQLSKDTDIKYELLRRVFCNKRKLSANELVLILEKTGISFEAIK